MPPIDGAISAREFGQIETEVKHLRDDIERLTRTLDIMADQVREMRDTVAQARGGWKTLLMLVTTGGAIGAFLAKFLPGHSLP